MKYSLLSAALVAESVMAFPFVARMPGVDSSLLAGSKDHLRARQQVGTGAGSAALCPYNPPSNHVAAAPISSQYPYNNAVNGLPGSGKGGYQVPAPGDTAHAFVAPGPNDIRGPCPGLNAAANHNFLAHDGIVTFNELVDAQQNLYNVGYDLAITLAILGLTTTDGDIVNEKLSIGCDATNRTSYNPALTGSEPGLDGHNKFEADTSLTRNDYFTHMGDNFSYNKTLFGMMTETTGGIYDRDGLALYRAQRYNQSLAENPNFYFGPFSLLLFGASSFLYELMPSGPNYTPDIDTISSFFGAGSAADGYAFTGNESIPQSYAWTNRVSPYSLMDVGNEILAQYLLHPVLFGGATGNGGFDLLNFGSIQNGVLATPTAESILCLIYQIATERVPSSINSVVSPVVDISSTLLSLLNPQFANFGCALALTK